MIQADIAETHWDYHWLQHAFRPIEIVPGVSFHFWDEKRPVLKRPVRAPPPPHQNSGECWGFCRRVLRKGLHSRKPAEEPSHRTPKVLQNFPKKLWVNTRNGMKKGNVWKRIQKTTRSVSDKMFSPYPAVKKSHRHFSQKFSPPQNWTNKFTATFCTVGNAKLK